MISHSTSFQFKRLRVVQSFTPSRIPIGLRDRPLSDRYFLTRRLRNVIYLKINAYDVRSWFRITYIVPSRLNRDTLVFSVPANRSDFLNFYCQRFFLAFCLKHVRKYRVLERVGRKTISPYTMLENMFSIFSPLKFLIVF